jgi:hypothetical protein
MRIGFRSERANVHCTPTQTLERLHQTFLQAARRDHRRDEDRRRREKDVAVMVMVMTVVMVEAACGRGRRGERSAGNHNSGGEAKDEFADHSQSSKEKALNANVLSHVRWSTRHRLSFSAQCDLAHSGKTSGPNENPGRVARPGFRTVSE